MKTRLAIAAIILLVAAAWLLWPERAATEPETTLPRAGAILAPIAEQAAPDTEAPVHDAEVLTREALPPAEDPLPAARELVFRDIFDGSPIAPEAIVVLEEDGSTRMVARPSEPLVLPSDEIAVFAVRFRDHLPVLAAVRGGSAGEQISLHAYPATRIEVRLENCDAQILDGQHMLQLSVEPSDLPMTGPDHGQWRSLLHRMHPSTREITIDSFMGPSVSLTPAKVEELRADAIQGLEWNRRAEDDSVSAVVLTAFTSKRAVDGDLLIWEQAPALLPMSWLCELPLMNLEPDAGSVPATSTSSEGERYGRFRGARGLTQLSLGWVDSGAIRGRLPRARDAAGLVPERVTIAAIVHGKDSPVNGTHFNTAEGAVDLETGAFQFEDLNPGTYQVTAVWSTASDAYLAAERVELGAGEHRELGTLQSRAGPPAEINIALADVSGRPLTPEEVFRAGSAHKGTVSVIDASDDPDGPSMNLDIECPLTVPIRVHGLREGRVWIHLGLRSRPEPEQLLPGVRYVGTKLDGDRIEFPSESRVDLSLQFGVGAVPVRFHFLVPEEGHGANYDVSIFHLSSGVEFPDWRYEAKQDERRRKEEQSIELPPGEYSILVLRNGGSRSTEDKPHYCAFGQFVVLEAETLIEIALEPGVVATGTVDDATRAKADGRFFFDLVSIAGVVEGGNNLVLSTIAEDGSFTVRGIPPATVLSERKTKTRWSVDPGGQLVRLP